VPDRDLVLVHSGKTDIARAPALTVRLREIIEAC
jgi:hypothetical protein